MSKDADIRFWRAAMARDWRCYRAERLPGMRAYFAGRVRHGIEMIRAAAARNHINSYRRPSWWNAGGI